MKILAFSDLHRDVEATKKIVELSKDADILVGAGDFATRGQGTAETIEILKTANLPTVIVSGNHDNSEELLQLCSSWQNGHHLHGQEVTFAGVSFYGLGGEIPLRNTAEWNEALSEDEASMMLSTCPKNSILVTHTPPFGHADLQRDGGHEGSTSILTVIEEKQPILNLCGHIHFSWGASGMIGKTSIHNLGPTVNWFEV
ncbi:MAG: metallophosphoesterase family protein [Rhizobiaceae bacterium]